MHVTLHMLDINRNHIGEWMETETTHNHGFLSIDAN